MPDDVVASLVAIFAIVTSLILYVAWRVRPFPPIARVDREGAGRLALHVARVPVRSIVWMRYALDYEGIEDEYELSGEVVVRAAGGELWRDRVTVASASPPTSQPLDPMQRGVRVGSFSTWLGSTRRGEVAASVALGSVTLDAPGPLDVELSLADGAHTRIRSLALWVSR